MNTFDVKSQLLPVLYKFDCPETANNLGDCQKIDKYNLQFLNHRYVHIQIQCSSRTLPKS